MSNRIDLTQFEELPDANRGDMAIGSMRILGYTKRNGTMTKSQTESKASGGGL